MIATPQQQRDTLIAPPPTGTKPEQLSGKTFITVAASETRVIISDYGELIEEVLVASGGSFASEVLPLLDSHQHGSVGQLIGTASNFRRKESEWLARCQLTEGVQVAEEAWQKIQAGALTSVSIGYFARAFKMVQPGQTASIDGRSYTANERLPLRVVTKWVVREVSLVIFPADSTARIVGSRSAAPVPSQVLRFEGIAVTDGTVRSVTKANGKRAAEITCAEGGEFRDQLLLYIDHYTDHLPIGFCRNFKFHKRIDRHLKTMDRYHCSPGKWTFEGLVNTNSPQGAEAAEKIRSGELHSVSLGYIRTDPGIELTHNEPFYHAGNKYYGDRYEPTRLLTTWRASEISLTDKPADPSCRIQNWEDTTILL